MPTSVNNFNFLAKLD